MSKDLNKIYEPSLVEDKIYDFWQNKGYFEAKVDPTKKPYTIVIPPPNITGKLHMGHALDDTLQDILIRFKRMKGYNAVWVPGTDHAAIATEAKIVEAMKSEGLTKEDLGREKFLERAFLWKEKYGNTIIEQIKKLGASCDWSRERFTMDEGCSKAVNEVFVMLYEKGLIYRGERIINWCPKCKTSVSDAEVDFSEKEGNFWHIKYPLTDGSGSVELATTRPETMLGDTAVAVNPNDERYNHLVGKTVMLPLVNREIPIIADEYVEMDFGTGVVKITPAHDPNDFEVGLRHNLPVINIMDESATMNEFADKYKGLDRYEARRQIVADLEQEGLLCKVEPIKHNVGTCYRCHETIEPRVSMQWFVKMEPLAKPAIDAVKNGDTKFVPARFDKIYFNWLENIKDWCISRQLWWGHRIPAYYCKDCGEVIVSRNEVTSCNKCGSKNVVQDEDTLDTWFSSALWPFSVFGWPDKTEDLDYFYPTATLVTGYDIIFFWVVRMMFSALEYTKKVPFKTVLIHGLVRDAQGRKMSKSLGNGIDPMEIIEKYGADALRFTLATGNSPGNDMRFSEERVSASRNFANKIWNAARFILMNLNGLDVKNEIPKQLKFEDKWILTKLNEVILEVTNNIEKFELGVAVQKLYDFIWDDFCDWYIEFSKIRLQNDKTDEITAQNTRSMLVYVMTETLKLLHPFMPFITEKIWQVLPHAGNSIMVSAYPEFNKDYCFESQKIQMESIMEAIRAIRNRRAQMNVPQSKKAKVYIATNNEPVFEDSKLFIEKLTYAGQIEIAESFDLPDAVTIVLPETTIYIPMDELIDKKAELIRLQKELDAAKKQVEQTKSQLANDGFMSKAPANVVENVKRIYETLKDKMESLESAILDLK
ncbi:MAG: Valine--tRNA ligase [Eubacteriales bacterium SKADARSKE-1]|nr:Valine--tRNA ligase [Eubacteriales bacterium SKADARSKE-1]